MSESQTETFTERVDATTQPDGAFIGTLEIQVPPATTRDVDHQEEINGSPARAYLNNRPSKRPVVLPATRRPMRRPTRPRRTAFTSPSDVRACTGALA